MTNLDKTLDDINKRWGDGSIMLMSDKPRKGIDAISTGCFSLDLATGVGGIPRGRSCEIFGKESSGKTTLMQHIVAEAQRAGLTAAYIDMEHALDINYAERCGVDIGKLLLSQPDAGEQALEIAEALARSGAVHLVVVDSIAKLVTRAEVEGDMGDSPMGGIARLMSQGLRKLAPVIAKNNVALVFTNQVRNKIGVIYGSPETQPGGLAIKFDASVRIQLTRVNAETDETHAHIAAKVIKNKVAPPFKKCEFDILYATGIDKIADLFSVCVTQNIIEHKGGGNYVYGDYKWRGKENMLQSLREDAVLAAELTERIRG